MIQRTLPEKLSDAIREGNIEDFQTIWNENRDKLQINEPISGNTCTPLMLACQLRQVEMVRYFLFELNADPNANLNDDTALILVCCGTTNFYTDYTDVSVEEEANVMQICKWLIERNVMIQKVNLKRQTALMCAAKNVSFFVVFLSLTKWSCFLIHFRDMHRWLNYCWTIKRF